MGETTALILHVVANVWN